VTDAMRLVGGRPVAIHEIGQGTPVLFLHGFGVDHRSLLSSVRPVFEQRPGYRRLHVDLPGFGASPSDPSIDSSDAAVVFVLELIDAVIGDERFLLVGQSWGAYLARAVVAERRDRILGVALDIPVVIATHADRDVAPAVILREEPGILDGAGLIGAGEFREIAVIIDGRAWDTFATTVLAAESAADAPTLERIGQRYAFTTDVDAIGEPFDRPSLIVVGRQDSVVGYRDALRLVERFPRSTFAILDAAGHLLEGERPALFAALVDDWLDRVERT
jgi:pimeloyl-ACP methyl ester carboxylesterase